MSKLYLLLLMACTVSALQIIDLRTSITRQTTLVGKGKEEEIRLDQEYAELKYAHTKAIDNKAVMQSAQSNDLHQPNPQNTLVIKLK